MTSLKVNVCMSLQAMIMYAAAAKVSALHVKLVATIRKVKTNVRPYLPLTFPFKWIGM